MLGGSQMTKRKEILHECFKLISKNGYDRTTTEMVCEAVGVKKPTLYYYFKSKEDLYLTLVNEFLQGDKANAFDLTVEKNDFKSQLVSYGIDFIENLKSDVYLSDFIIELYIQAKRTGFLSDGVHEMNQAFKKNISQIVKLGEKFEFFKHNDRISNCELILTVIHGIEFSIAFGSELNQEQVWRNMVDKLFE